MSTKRRKPFLTGKGVKLPIKARQEAFSKEVERIAKAYQIDGFFLVAGIERGEGKDVSVMISACCNKHGEGMILGLVGEAILSIGESDRPLLAKLERVAAQAIGEVNTWERHCAPKERPS